MSRISFWGFFVHLSCLLTMLLRGKHLTVITSVKSIQCHPVKTGEKEGRGKRERETFVQAHMVSGDPATRTA